jgi:hypothetical protein
MPCVRRDAAMSRASIDASPEDSAASRSSTGDVEILAAIGARSIYGNERAFRDALYVLRDTGYPIDLICYRSAWNNAVHQYFASSCRRLMRLPLCDYPIRGYILKRLVGFVPRYAARNFFLIRWLLQRKRLRKRSLILCSDDVFLTLNIVARRSNIPALNRVGSLLGTQNVFKRVVFAIVKSVVARFALDRAADVIVAATRALTTVRKDLVA